jgi:hypothetical protein
MEPIDDPIISTLPVYLNTEIEAQLHLLAYPLRPSYRPPSLPAAVSVRLGKRSFEAEYPLISNEGEKDLIERADEELHFNAQAAQTNQSKRLMMRSSEVPNKVLHAVGCVKNGAFHIAPLSSIQLVKPVIGSSDDYDIEHAPQVHNTSSNTNNNNGANGGSGPSSVKLQVSYRRAPRSDFQRSTFANAGQAPTPLISLQPHDESSPRAEFLREKLVSSTGAMNATVRSLGSGTRSRTSSSLSTSNASSSSLSLSPGLLTSSEYLKNVASAAHRVPEPKSAGRNIGDVPTVSWDNKKYIDPYAVNWKSVTDDKLAITDFSKQPLGVQVEECLRRAHALPFVRILEFTSAAETVKDALVAVRNVARLVRGSWVLKSEKYFQMQISTKKGGNDVTTSSSSSSSTQKTNRGLSSSSSSSSSSSNFGFGHNLSSSSSSSSSAPPTQYELGISHQPIWVSEPRISITKLKATATYHSTRPAYKLLHPNIQGRLIMCRDLILSLFIKSDTVDVTLLTQKTRIRTSRILEYLGEVANQVAGSSTLWRWKRSIDSAAKFTAKFPAVVLEEEKWWTKREIEINALFSSNEEMEEEEEVDEDGEGGIEMTDERGIE